MNNTKNKPRRSLKVFAVFECPMCQLKRAAEILDFPQANCPECSKEGRMSRMKVMPLPERSFTELDSDSKWVLDDEIWTRYSLFYQDEDPFDALRVP